MLPNKKHKMIIKKKTWPEEFELVQSGKKKFDVRLADFECKIGDVLVLEEWDPKTGSYTGRSMEKEITFIMKAEDAKKFQSEEAINKHGLYVISI